MVAGNDFTGQLILQLDQSLEMLMANARILYKSLMSFSICLMSLQSSVAREAEFEWIIEQNLADTGGATVYVSHDAVKLVSKRVKSRILMKAPLWNVYVINDEEKTFWRGRLDQFTAGKLVNPFSDNYSGSALSEESARRSNNQTATLIKPLTNVIGSGSIQGLRYTQYGWEDAKHNHAVIWAADDIELAPQCARLLCRALHTPDCPKPPLYCRFNAQPATYSKEHAMLKQSTIYVPPFGGINSEVRDLRIGPVARLTTQSWKKIPLNNQDFVLPVGYKRLERMTSVTFSSKVKNELTTFIDEAGYLSPSSAPARKATAQIEKSKQ